MGNAGSKAAAKVERMRMEVPGEELELFGWHPAGTEAMSRAFRRLGDGAAGWTPERWDEAYYDRLFTFEFPDGAVLDIWLMYDGGLRKWTLCGVQAGDAAHIWVSEGEAPPAGLGRGLIGWPEQGPAGTYRYEYAGTVYELVLADGGAALGRFEERVAKAYGDGDFDLYEDLVARGAARFGVDEGMFEDWCTDARLFGPGRCG